jgi:DNA-binding CsgD family transcriptional regulator
MTVRRTPEPGSRRYSLRHDGKEIEVSGELVIGRNLDCQIPLDDGLTSRRHARMYVTEEGLTIEDLGSRNGVFVNQKRIRTPTLLAHGDVVGIGRESFEVVDMIVVPRTNKPTIPAPFGSDTDGPELVTATPQLGVLTEREREVFELIVLGHTQSEIGAQLHVSVKTVESHRAHIVEKLNCRTRAELVAYALTAGVLMRPKR